jgi:hypothetical protein
MSAEEWDRAGQLRFCGRVLSGGYQSSAKWETHRLYRHVLRVQNYDAQYDPEADHQNEKPDQVRLRCNCRVGVFSSHGPFLR